MENNPFGVGAIEKEQSPTDFELGAISLPIEIPKVYLPEWKSEIQMQSKQPTCGANSGTALKNSQDDFDGSFSYLWKKIKSIDVYPVDSGTSMDFIFKALAGFGVCSKDMLQGDVSLDTTSFLNSLQTTPEMDADALKHRISSYAYTWSPTFEQIKQTIYKHKGAILLLKIGQEFWTPSWSEKDIMPLKNIGTPVSGHFVFAYGYDEKYIYFINSWSKGWAKDGIGYFDESYVSRVMQMGTAVDLNGYIFPRLLKKGMSGTDVGILQSYLKKEGLFKVGITSFYGSITEQAVKDLQRKYANEILKPVGLTEPTGLAYRSTLSFLEKKYN